MWPIRPVDEAQVQALAAGARISNVLARLLWLRNVKDAEAARRWLAPALSDFHSPLDLPDFRAAADRIRQAIERREGILVWGHDDLDGLAATALLVRVLSGLQARPFYYVPVKGKEKHGLNAAVAAGFGKQGVGLVVTVDCGITNRDPVAELKEAGIDVVVTDHHELLAFMPDAVANVDPKRPDSRYPYRGLAGCGVALKLGMGLAHERLGLSVSEFFSAQPDAVGLAVLGSLADRVPLTDENRTLVSLGMTRLENTRLPAVRLVLERVRQGGRLTPARMVGDLVPLFSSAEGTEGVRSILNEDPAQAREWLEILSQRTTEWHAEAERSLELAEKQVRVGDGIVIVQSKELAMRTLSYCAAKLKERYRAPALVLGWRGDAWVGECRTVEGVDLMALLRALDRYFIDYGGHKAAAGFSIEDGRVEGFIASAEGYAHEHIAGRVPAEQPVSADAAIPLAEFDPALRVMAPFGDGNPAPVFISEPVTVETTIAGWVCSTRRDMALKPARQDVAPGTGPVVLLYTIDDFGEPAVLDFRPSHAESTKDKV
jgi:single-stranded-DNA-specific exonuclease